MTIIANGVIYLRGVDSVNVNVLKTLPFVPDVVGGYDNGNWPDEPNVAALFPGVYMIDYTVFLANLGDAADDETGDLTNAQLVTWMKERLAAGVWKPIVYTSESNVATIVALLATNGIARASYRIQSAHYLWSGTLPGLAKGQHICGPTTCSCTVQCDGTQWTDHGTLDWDESLFLTSFIYTAPPVVTPPPPPVTIGSPTTYSEDDMTSYPVSIFTTDSNGWFAVGLPAGVTSNKVVSVLPAWASGYDTQGWHACVGSVDFQGNRVEFRSFLPNDVFTATIWVAN